MNQLKDLIKNKAIELGFDLIGFAKVEPLDIEFDNYIHWLELSYNADMEYLERNKEKRKNVGLILENAKTVIVTAINYNTPFEHNNEKCQSKGKISRYAWGEDYHNVVLPKLESLSAEIKKIFPESESKCYVDTGPILEKAWAVKAGIGWQGKNSLILTRRFGSYMFLGIIISTIEIEPDKIVKDYCGKCNLCIESCPTGAIVSPKVIDSRKCISYWTIETKGKKEFPEIVSKNLNGWFFGCDICQEVCPWNRKKIYTECKEFYPRNNQTEIECERMLNMEEDEFQIRFKNSPLKRAKLEGLKHNMIYLSQKKSGL